MKKWLIEWLLKEERPRIFALAQKDMLETMEDDLERRAEILAKEKLKNFMSLIDANDVIAQKGNQIYINGEILTAEKVSNLKAEADFFTASELWKVLHGTPKELAQRAMFTDDGKIDTQMLKGRAILFTLDTQQKIIEVLQKLSPTK